MHKENAPRNSPEYDILHKENAFVQINTQEYGNFLKKCNLLE
jgi:hypothetical protein